MAKHTNWVAWGLAAVLTAAVLFFGTTAKGNGRIAMSKPQPTAWKGSVSQETDWISFCQFELVSGNLLVKDASGPPTADLLPPEWLKKLSKYVVRGALPPGSHLTPLGDAQTHYDLPPGDYVVAARCMQWGKDRRVSRLRVVLKGSRIQLGKKIGSVCTDTAAIGVCDRDVFSAAWRDHPGDARNEMEDHVSGGEIYGSFALDEQHRAVMAFAHTGFGDGGYPVYGLVSGSKRVGVEVVFIKENEPYPF